MRIRTSTDHTPTTVTAPVFSAYHRLFSVCHWRLARQCPNDSPPSRTHRIPTRRAAGLLLLTLLAIALPPTPGCTAHRANEIDLLTQATDARDPARAVTLNRKALAAKSDPDKAVRLLEAAVAADPSFGPAHNNLGIAYLSQRKYHRAAQHFDRAARLMPASPQPLTNLGLTYEAVRRPADALAQYDTALARDPNHLPAKMAAARVLIQTDTDPTRAHDLLRQIALQSENPTWQTWAQTQLTKHHPPTD